MTDKGIGTEYRNKLAQVINVAKGLITPALVSKTLNVSLQEAGRILSRWNKQGWVKRIKRGVYIPIPAEDVTGEVAATPDEPGEQIAAGEEAPKKPDEPLMVGSAERMWVKIEMKPKVPAPKTVRSSSDGAKIASTSKSKSTLTDGDFGDKTSNIREAWLWGSVLLHQDPAKGESGGKNASGEALYLDNPGEGKAITFIYQRDPNESTYLPGPLPAARAQNENKSIAADGFIAMNQGTDQVWVVGPGTLTEFTKRAIGS